MRPLLELSAAPLKSDFIFIPLDLFSLHNNLNMIEIFIKFNTLNMPWLLTIYKNRHACLSLTSYVPISSPNYAFHVTRVLLPSPLLATPFLSFPLEEEVEIIK